MRMTGKSACALSATGILGKHASKINNRASNTQPTYRKYRASGMRLLHLRNRPPREDEPDTVLSRQNVRFASTSRDPRLQQVLLPRQIRLAPAGPIHRAAAVHRRAYSTDAGRRHRTRDRPRTQHDAGSCGAARRVVDVLAVDDG